MTDSDKKFKKILKEIENEEDKEVILSKMLEVYTIFSKELEKVQEENDEKIAKILEMQVKLEKRLNEIEKSIFDDEDSDFSIICPYCNHEFIIETDELKDEIECPECENIIELDWGEDDDCSCGGDCHKCHHDEDEDM